MADVILHCGTNMPPCEPGCYYVQYIMYTHAMLTYLRISSPWLLTGHILLDLYHDGFSQTLLMSKVTPLVGRSQKERHQTKDVKKYSPRSIYVKYSPSTPFHLQRCPPIVVDWTPTTGLTPCQVQSGPAHGLWSPSNRQWVQGNTNCMRL